MHFHEIVKNLRESMNLTQLKVSSDLKIANRQYQRYEAGTSEPTLSVLIAIADYFDVSLDYLVGRSDERAHNLGNSNNLDKS